MTGPEVTFNGDGSATVTNAAGVGSTWHVVEEGGVWLARNEYGTSMKAWPSQTAPATYASRGEALRKLGVEVAS